MSRITPRPHRFSSRACPKEISVGFHNPPKIAPLTEEEPKVSLLTAMFQYLIGVNLVERVVLKRKRDIIQVVQDVRVMVWIYVQSYQFVPF